MSEQVKTPSKGGEARIDYESGVTLNMGDFESARVSVRLSVPCELSPRKIDTMFEFARGWVQDRLEAEVESLTDEGGE